MPRALEKQIGFRGVHAQEAQVQTIRHVFGLAPAPVARKLQTKFSFGLVPHKKGHVADAQRPDQPTYSTRMALASGIVSLA